ncbi:MAG TPA: BrnT family toxin [Rhizomicrobium sp.]
MKRSRMGRRQGGEESSITIGMAKGRLLTVVRAERGERIRIISARRAEKQECDDYYKKQMSA